MPVSQLQQIEIFLNDMAGRCFSGAPKSQQAGVPVPHPSVLGRGSQSELMVLMPPLNELGLGSGISSPVPVNHLTVREQGHSGSSDESQTSGRSFVH